ncbi:hypothetical protein PILCRDRAFT_247 [Piloderma croceum F 1598]|uniref:Chromo domain-containing protein n=1 Tax=Piloderma croceum (strain F 1598) TaxID=765440 RepID=A0A0C3G7F9_PILCF|nr:hypothetical protein PILCRDRAFT_247 [Piloderma croceum F 1598]
MDEIINSRRRGRGWQFLVRWSGYGPQHDLWLAAGKLADCEALDLWYRNGGDGPDTRVSRWCKTQRVSNNFKNLTEIKGKAGRKKKAESTGLHGMPQNWKKKKIPLPPLISHPEFHLN